MRILTLAFLALIGSIGLLAPNGSNAQTKGLKRSDVVKDPDAIQKHTNIALLIGIGDYDKGLTGLPPLKYPVPDIAAIGGVLKQQGYEVAMLTDHAATAAAIKDSFRELTKVLDPGEGTFLFYFSGHGFRAGNANYLATFGTTVSDLANQGLQVNEVEKLLLATGAKRRIAFIDACRNDPEGARSVGAPTRSFQDLKDAEGLRMLLSTAPGDVSYEDDALGHGVFSFFVLQGLAGKAADSSDGLVTFDDLRNYVTREMRSYSVAHRRAQKPFQMGESTGDFLVAKKLDSQALARAENAPPPAVLTPTSVPATTPQPLTAQPAGSGITRSSPGGITSITGGGTSQKVDFLWQSDAHPGMLFSLRLDSDAIYLYTAQGNLIGTLLKKEKKDKKGVHEFYMGMVPLRPANGCPGGRGAMKVNTWNENRIEALIEQPIKNTEDGRVSCNGSGTAGEDRVSRWLSTGLEGSSWQAVTFVKK